MIVMQYGKIRAKEPCPAAPYSNKLTARKTSIDELRGYYSTSPDANSPKSLSGAPRRAGREGWGETLQLRHARCAAGSLAGAAQRCPGRWQQRPAGRSGTNTSQ